MRDPLSLIACLLETFLAILYALPRRHGWLIGGIEIFLMAASVILVVSYLLR